MSRNYYSEINLHFIWHTKESLPLLTPKIEPFVHRYLKQRIVNMPEVFVHEVGGTATHVHLAVSIPSSLLISDFVGQLKGSSSHETNSQIGNGDNILQWQSGYGVVSFGTGDLEWVKNYIRDQKEHHSRPNDSNRLEWTFYPNP